MMILRIALSPAAILSNIRAYTESQIYRMVSNTSTSIVAVRSIEQQGVLHQPDRVCSSEGKLDRLALGSELYVLYIVKPQC